MIIRVCLRLFSQHIERRKLFYGFFLLMISFTGLNGQLFDNEGNLNREVRTVVYGEYDLNKKSERLYVLKNIVGTKQHDIKLLFSKKETIVRSNYPQLYTRYISLSLADENKGTYRFMTIWVRKNKVMVDGEEVEFLDFLKRLKVIDEYNKQIEMK